MLVCKQDKWEEFINPLLKEHKVQPMELPNDKWDAVGTQLCYHFSMKEEKCPHWQNCIFLHVDTKRLKEKFKQYRCMCGKNDGLCEFGKHGTCFYAHRQSELTIPADLQRSAFPHSNESRKLVWTNGDGLDKTFQLPVKYIAQTFLKDDDRLCPRTTDWCNRVECKHGVHITPDGWAWLRLECSENDENVPAPPIYFRAKVDALVGKDPRAKPKTSKPQKMAWNVEAVQSPADATPAWQADDSGDFPVLGAPKSKPQAKSPTKPKAKAGTKAASQGAPQAETSEAPGSSSAAATKKDQTYYTSKLLHKLL